MVNGCDDVKENSTKLFVCLTLFSCQKNQNPQQWNV